MPRVSSLSIAFTSWIVCGVSFAVLEPPAVRADCAHWDIGGHWVIQQGNGITVTMDLTQTGTDVRGTASFVSGETAGLFPQELKSSGSITGTIDDNNNILLNADWGGVYRGGVGSDEIMRGSTFAVNDPGNQVQWSGDRKATCQVVEEPSATTPPSHAPTPLEEAGVLKNRPGVGDITTQTKPTPVPAGGNPTATVIADVDVYKAAGGEGKPIGVLRSNNKTTKVSLAAPCQDNWCHVKGDPVPTGEGWVYSGTPPDFQSLEF